MLPSVLQDLPLWRVQWVALPGHVQCLHVHVPHYVDLFERLVASAGGASPDASSEVLFGPEDGPIYGHLLLPGGSASLGDEVARLGKDSSAPNVGSLLRLREIRRLADGRLAVRSEFEELQRQYKHMESMKKVSARRELGRRAV